MTPTEEHQFTRFVSQRTPHLLRVAYALTGDQHAAQDLLQNAFAKAFTAWRRIEGNAEPYVRRILYHEHVSRWRRILRRERLVAQVPDSPAGRDAADGVDLRLSLRMALLSLPPRQRAVLVLRFLEDCSVEETAAVLGCGEGTVVSQSSRALAKLRAVVPDGFISRGLRA